MPKRTKANEVESNLTQQPLKLIVRFSEERETSLLELIVRQDAEMFQTDSCLDVLNTEQSGRLEMCFLP